MSYSIHSIFDTIQGEGARSGTRAVFLRMSGCSLWDGLEEHRDRGKGACARWCDTDFAKGDRMDAIDVLERLEKLWPPASATAQGSPRWVVITGGEPLLQLDQRLVDLLHGANWLIAVESNGSAAPADGDALLDALDWLCVSPKLDRTGQPHRLAVKRGHELKVVLPGAAAEGEPGWTDALLEDLFANTGFLHYYVQPQDPILPGHVGATYLHGNIVGARPEYEAHAARCIDFVRRHPRWRLSLQIHKLVGVP